MAPFERALVSFYRPSIVTFPLSLRVLEILSLLFCIMPPFPYRTSSLKIPKFPHVPLGLGGSLFGYKERRCWANCPCNQFPRFPTYVITIHQRHRQTDGRHAIPRPRICTKVHCAVKTVSTAAVQSKCRFECTLCITGLRKQNFKIRVFEISNIQLKAWLAPQTSLK